MRLCFSLYFSKLQDSLSWKGEEEIKLSTSLLTCGMVLVVLALVSFREHQTKRLLFF